VSDKKKSKAQLIEELETTQARLAVLEREQAEREQGYEAFREAEDRFRIIFHQTPDVIVVVDGESRQILAANESAQRVLGYDPYVLVGKPVDALHRAVPECGPDFYEDACAQDATFQSLDFLRADGSICPMDLTATVVPWDEKTAIILTLRDVTERRQMGLLI